MYSNFICNQHAEHGKRIDFENPGQSTLLLSDNIYKFGSKNYRFDESLPMGNPLSPLVTEVFLGHVERISILSILTRSSNPLI